MSDEHDANERPRPQYGEYASPEEQRAAIKQPAEWQLEAQQTDAAPPQPTPGAYQPGNGDRSGSQYPDYHRAEPPYQQHLYEQHRYQHPYEQRPAGRPAPRANLGDRIATFFLLAYGLYSVIDMIANAVQGGAIVQQSAQVVDPADGQFIASFPDWVWTAAAVVYAVVWLIALLTSLRAMRAGRIAFWIPLVAAIVAGLVVLAVMVIAMGENPALLNDVPTPGGTGSPS
jgi:hypothetical protein